MPLGKPAIAKKVARKRRPRGSGKFPNVAIRFSPQEITRVDRYAKERKMTRSEAVRELVAKGLGDK